MNDNIQRSPDQGAARPGGQKSGGKVTKRGGCAIAVVAAVVLYLIVYWLTDGLGLDDDSEFYGDESDRYSEYQTYLGSPIPRFTPNDARSLSQSLAEAERRYGVCFGWKLTDGSMDAEQSYSDDSGSGEDPRESFDQGSSRGPDVPAEVCPRWVEVRVTVAYTSESSDYWSGVRLRVEGSENFSPSELPGDEEFAELGITAERFIDAPVQTTGHAALSLPLLMTQTGALRQQPADGDSSGTKPQRPLPPAESEGSSAWVWFGVLAAITLAAAGLGVAGVVRRKSAGDSGQSGSGGHGGPPPGSPGPGPQSPGPQGPQSPTGGDPPQGQPPHGQAFTGRPPQAFPGQPPQGPPPGIPYRGEPPQGPAGSPPWPPQGPQQGPPPQGPGPAPR